MSNPGDSSAQLYASNPLVSPLWEKTQQTPHDIALRFIIGSTPDDVDEWTWAEFLHGIVTAQADLRAAGITAGDRVMMILPSSADYLLTFWALIAIGAQPVSVPLTPEAPLAAGVSTLRHIAANCNPVALLTTPAKQQELVTLQQDDTTLLPGLTVLTPHYQRPTHPYLPASLDELAPHPVGPDTVVYVQYSSGSTGKPKGVLDTYRCILWQLDVMRITWNSDTPPVSISWLPLHHDMGIVWGIFDILCLGGCAGYIPTALFAKNPTIWVNAMSTYKCGMTAAPDTMWRTICGLYQDPARRAGLDFSSLRVAVDGSEPVNTTTQPLLAATFGECGWTSTTLTPMYGLSEGGLAMSGHLGPREAVCIHFDAPTAARGQIVPADLNPADPAQRTLYSVGDNFFGGDMRIVDPDTCQVLDDCQVGEVWFRGDVAAGYLGNPALTDATFHARTTDDDGPYLRTGDYGFLCDGNLYISGRLSNTIIVGGENYFPSDIEELVAAANLGFTTAQCCATQPDIDGPWYLVMGEAANIDILDRTAYSGLLSRAIARSTGKQPARVLWTDNALPRTSSGKIARGEVAQLALQILAEQQRDGSTAHYDNAGGRGTSGASKGSDDGTEGADSEDPDGEAGSRNSAAAASTDPTQHPVVVQLADQLSCPPDAVDLRADVSELGLTSLAVNEFLSWAGHTGHTLDPVEVWENPTVGAWMGLYDLAAAATAQQGDAADGTQCGDAASTSADTATTSITRPDGAANAAPDAATSTPTDLQKSYLVGADPSQPWGGINCLAYAEFEPNLGTLTPADFCAALREAVALVDQEPALHTALPTTETTCYADRPAPDVAVIDLTGVAADQLAAAREELRHVYLHRHFDTPQGENWALAVSTLPDGTTTVHVALSLIAADIVGVGEILARLDAALQGDTERAFPSHAHHTATGRAAAERAGTHHPARSITSDAAGTAPNPAAAPIPARGLPLPPDVPTLDTGSTHPNPQVTRFTHAFTTPQWQALSATARTLGTTPASITLACYDAILRRWSSRDDFLVTLTTINAPQPGHVAERTIAVAHRAHCPLGSPWADTLVAVRTDLRAGIANPTPLGVELRHALASPAGHTGLSPFIFTYSADRPLLAEPLSVLGAPTELRSTTPQVLIDCQVVNVSGHVTLSCDIRTDGIRADVAAQMFQALVDLITLQCAGHPQQLAQRPLIDLVPLPAATRTQREAANSSAPVTTSSLLYTPFRENVQKQPKAVAVVWAPEDQPTDKTVGDPLGYNRRGYLTYQELDCMARRLAAKLIPLTHPNQVIGIQLPKGPCQVIATLGVLYAGCAYLPIGLHQPEERLRAIANSAGMEIVLRREDMAELISDELGGRPRPACHQAIPRVVEANELAYIIYTSGSTGTPKGVAIRHYSALNTCLDVNARNQVTAKDNCLAISALEFDLSVYDIFGMLAAGGTIVCIGDESRRDAFRWADLVKRFRVTIWNTVPGLGEMLYAAALGSQLPSLRRFYFSGDWIAMDLPKRLATISPDATCISMGGATEGSIWSNEYVVTDVDFPADWTSIPYGGPLTGQKYRVVNPNVPGFPDQPDYVPGELWIGGAGVAAGYFGQPELTAERYPVDEQGERWYRTGDLGEYHTDGLIFFVGRMDTQVKIRGHRVECGEVEHACRALTGVETAIVVPIRKNSALGAVLVTGATGAKPGSEPGSVDDSTDGAAAVAAGVQLADPAHLRAQLATKLPDYMVPAVVMPRESLPHTTNGKIDRRLLATELESYQHEQATGYRGAAAATETPIAGATIAPTVGTAGATVSATAARADGSTITAENTPGVVGVPQLDSFEQQVVNAWAAVLGEEPEVLATQLAAERAGTKPVNFFALGGDSLAATTVATSLVQAGCQVTVADLFAAPTLEAFIVRARGKLTATPVASQDAAPAAASAVVPAAATTAAPTAVSEPAAPTATPLSGTSFPLTSLQQAYALGADGVRGITCTTPAVGVIISSGDGSALDPQRFATLIAELTAAWEPLRCVRSGDNEQAVVDAATVPTAAPVLTLRAPTGADLTTDSGVEAALAALRAELSGQRIPLDAVPMVQVVAVEGLTTHVGLSMNYLGLDARSIGVLFNTILDRYEGAADTFPVDPSAQPFYEYVQRELAAGTAGYSADHVSGYSADARPQQLPPAPSLPVTTKKWTATSDARFSSLHTQLSVADTRALQTAAAHAGVTVSAVVLQAYGAVIAASSGLDVCGISVPISQRPSTNTAQQGSREVLGNFTELALCTLGTESSVTDVHRTLGHIGDGTLPNSRDIARAGRAAYPVVFTSTTGVAALHRSGTLTPSWVLTRTPGVQLDCQVSMVGDQLELRWDYPVEYMHAQRLHHLFTRFVDQVTAFSADPAPNELDTELADLAQQLATSQPPSPQQIMAAALEHLDTHTEGIQHTPSRTPLPQYVPLVELWRNRVQDVDVAQAPLTADARRTGTWLADALCGGFDATDIIGHPVLSPQALLVHDPAAASIVTDIARLLAQKAEQLGRPVSVVELGSGTGLVRTLIERELTPTGAAGASVDVSWQSVERDARWRKSATTHNEMPLEALSDIPADVVLAVGSLHRDPRLVRDVAQVPTLREAEVVVVETTELSDAALVSAAVIDPTLLESAATVLQNAGQWWMNLTTAGWQPYAMSTPASYICVLQGKREEATAAELCPLPADTPAGSGLPEPELSPEELAAARTVLEAWHSVLPDAASLQVENPANLSADFFALGGDSLAATRVLQQLKQAGYQTLRLVDLFNTPELSELAVLLSKMERVTVDTDGDGAADDSHPATHPLTGVQQAYLAGRSDAHILGGVASHCYYEFTTTSLDRTAFAQAITTVVDAHDELRALIVDGQATIQPATPAHILTTVEDPRAATEAETPDPTQQVGMVVRLSPADVPGPVTISIGMDNLILDGASMMLVLQEIDATYRELAAGQPASLPQESLSFGAYLATHQEALDPADITDPAAAHRVAEARAYWSSEVATLPAAPQIAERAQVVAIREPKIDRVSADVPAELWAAVQQSAKQSRVTAASLVLAAYAVELGQWSGSSDFTVNVTLFDRDVSVPGVNRVVGDFTSLTPVACRVLPGDSLEEVARAVQQTLASVRDYDAAGALWVQRELLQLTGDPYASMLPVVFTCGLGLVADGVSTTDFSFGTLGRVRSQTPQTLLDLQVHEDVKGLHLTADYVTQALDAQRVQDAISAVAQRICDCAERVHGAQAVAAGAADAAGDGAAAAGGVAGAAASITTPADQLATSPADNPATVLADQPTADTVPVTAASAADLTGPAADLYAQIAALWEAALEGVAVTLDSNFFKEGGDSLRATMVTRQVQDTTGREVDLRILLTNPTLRDYLQAVSAVPAATATEVGELDDYPNSPGFPDRAGAGVVVGTLPHGGDQADSSLADADLEEGTL